MRALKKCDGFVSIKEMVESFLSNDSDRRSNSQKQKSTFKMQQNDEKIEVVSN